MNPRDTDPLYVPEPDTHGTGRPVLGVVFLLFGAVAVVVIGWMVWR